MATRRRDFLALWGQAVLAAQSAPELRTFSDLEVAALRRAALVMIPADERSAGGGAPGVIDYIDRVVAHGSTALRTEWRWGLGQLAKSKNIEKTLRVLSKNEFQPRSREDQFFVLLKSALVEAFYTSEEGITKELGYQGMGHVMEFPDFTNIETKTPAGFKPMLKARA
jgi:hypothetical protein